MKEQNGENLEKGRSRKNSSGLKKRRSRIISLAAVGAAAIVIVSAVVALWGRDTYELKEPAYMCVNGSRFDLKGDVRLYHKNDRTTLNMRWRIILLSLPTAGRCFYRKAAHGQEPRMT